MADHATGFGAAGLTALLLMTGCGGDDRPATDAGTGADAGPTLDAAPGDGGLTDDGGGTPDSGPSDAGPPPVCTDNCGGDPTGSWVGVDTCYHDNVFITGCPTGEVLDERHEVTHSMDFAADGTWSWTVDASQRFLDYIVPASCIDSTITQCNEIGTGGISTGITNCTGDRSVECTCNFRTIPITMPSTRTGTWALEGDQVRVTIPPDSALFDICQRDDVLWIQTADVPAGRSTTQYLMQRAP